MPACATSSRPSAARRHQGWPGPAIWHDYNWTGAYIGGFGRRLVWGDESWRFTTQINAAVTGRS